MIGRTLSHYKVLEEISRGGMGIVYKALDLKLNREIALPLDAWVGNIIWEMRRIRGNGISVSAAGFESRESPVVEIVGC